MKDIMKIDGIECYEKDEVAYLKLETVARVPLIYMMYIYIKILDNKHNI